MSKLDLSLPVEQNIELIEEGIKKDMGNREIYQQAVLDCSLMMEREPFNALLYRVRGHRNLSLSNVELAIADLTMSTRIDPAYWKNWDLLGMAAYYLGDYEKAVHYYNRGLDVTGYDDPYTAPLLNWKYLALCHLGKREEAETQQLLTHIDPEDNDPKSIYKNLILLHRGIRSDEDIWELTKANEAFMLASLGYGVVMKHYYSGDKAKAKEILDDILARTEDWYTWGHKACEFDRQRLF